MVLTKERLDGIFQEHGDRHRSDSAGNGRNRSRDVLNSWKIDIAGHFSVVTTVDADIDDGRTGFDEISGDESGPADRRDQDIRLAAQGRQITGSRVGDRHRGMCVQHQLGNRFPDNIAAADDDTALTADGDLIMPQHGHDPGRSAGNKTIPAHREQTNIDSVEPVDILLRPDGLGDHELVEMGRQRQLAENTAHLFIMVQGLNQFKDMFLFRVCRQLIAE